MWLEYFLTKACSYVKSQVADEMVNLVTPSSASPGTDKNQSRLLWPFQPNLNRWHSHWHLLRSQRKASFFGQSHLGESHFQRDYCQLRCGRFQERLVTHPLGSMYIPL